jgi:hypothetical protein
MYRSPPPVPRHLGDQSFSLGWFGQALLAAVPSALAALFWLSSYEAMPRWLLSIVEAIMLGGMALSAIYWQARWARAFNWYSGFVVLGVAWGVGYGIVSLIYQLFHQMPTFLHIEIDAISGYDIDWTIVIGAAAIGLILACAQWYLHRPRGLVGRAALLLTALGNTSAWIGLFPLMLGGYIA